MEISERMTTVNAYMCVCGGFIQVRVMISDFAVFFAICIMVFVDVLVGLDTDKLEVPANFEASCAHF